MSDKVPEIQWTPLKAAVAMGTNLLAQPTIVLMAKAKDEKEATSYFEAFVRAVGVMLAAVPEVASTMETDAVAKSIINSAMHGRRDQGEKS